MNTKTATAQRRDTQQPVSVATPAPDTSNQQVAVLGPPRLPYPGRNIFDAFGLTPGAWKVLVEATFPSAKTPQSVIMALAYCRERHLDIFKRPVHIVPMWDSKGGSEGRGGYVETIWPGISEVRTTAARTGNYAGCDEAEFGPMVTEEFEGQVGRGAERTTKKITVTFPEWCRMTVYRMLPNGDRCKFVGPKVKWKETYATIGRTNLPNEMWQERSEGQIEKCAEAAALRRAFPEELGNEYTADEMAGRVIDHEPLAIAHGNSPSGNGGPPSPEQVKGAAQQQVPDDAVGVVDDGEVVDGEIVEDENPAVAQTQAQPANTQTSAKGAQADGLTLDEREWLRELSGAFSGCEDLGTFVDTQLEMMAQEKEKVSTFAWAKAQGLAEDTYRRVSNIKTK